MKATERKNEQHLDMKQRGELTISFLNLFFRKEISCKIFYRFEQLLRKEGNIRDQSLNLFLKKKEKNVNTSRVYIRGI